MWSVKGMELTHILRVRLKQKLHFNLLSFQTICVYLLPKTGFIIIHFFPEYQYPLMTLIFFYSKYFECRSTLFYISLFFFSKLLSITYYTYFHKGKTSKKHHKRQSCKLASENC